MCDSAICIVLIHENILFSGVLSIQSVKLAPGVMNILPYVSVDVRFGKIYEHLSSCN